MKKSLAALPILLFASHGHANTYLAAIGVTQVTQQQQGAAVVCPTAVVGESYMGIVDWDGPGSTGATIKAVLGGAKWPVAIVAVTELTVTNQITSDHLKGKWIIAISANPIGTTAFGTFDAMFKPFKNDSVTATIEFFAPAFGCNYRFNVAMTRIGK
jgi:hypothetical protein